MVNLSSIPIFLVSYFLHPSIKHTEQTKKENKLLLINSQFCINLYFVPRVTFRSWTVANVTHLKSYKISSGSNHIQLGFDLLCWIHNSLANPFQRYNLRKVATKGKIRMQERSTTCNTLPAHVLTSRVWPFS